LGRKTLALVKAIIILPGNAIIVIPGLLLYLEGGINPGWGLGGAMMFGGGLLVAFGSVLALHTVGLFFTHGEGTPAPWEPPKRLVVRGAYRYVRNPMITGALSILLGGAMVLGSKYILIWAIVFFGMNNFYFIFIEEPGLEKRFGDEYLQYKREVPRWLPRLRAYK
jgi:protein-S-isoprenylcysteine O-methyltransferase Ste14